MENDNLIQHATAKAVNIPKSCFQLYLSSFKNKSGSVKPVGTLLNIPAENENEFAAHLKCMAKWVPPPSPDYN